MVSWFVIIIGIVVAQRLIELIIAKRNGIYIRSVGGFEVGEGHYPLLVVLHICFILFLLAEVSVRKTYTMAPDPIPFGFFCLAQGMRIWCMVSLGKFWNTRIFILPASYPVTRGPYRFIRHPNYLVVAIEFLMLPLSFGAVATAGIFSLLNSLILRIRIKTEEQALYQFTNYEIPMQSRFRFLPVRRR